MINLLLSTTAILTALTLSACQAEPVQPVSPTTLGTTKKSASNTNAMHCIQLKEKLNLPSEVLISMDLAPLSTFETLPINSGQFRAETGGAIIKVEVEQIQGEYKISRSYSEPGIQANLKNYTAICLDQHLIYTDTMAMSLSSEGLLWLELDSGHEFISPNLWLLLNKN